MVLQSCEPGDCVNGIGRFEHKVSGNENIGSCLDHVLTGFEINAAVNLNVGFGIMGFNELLEPLYLLHSSRQEFLSGEAGVD